MRPEKKIRQRARSAAGATALLVVALAATVRAQPSAADAESIPPDFAGRKSPLAADAKASERGRALFVDNCASCHGEGADGHGPASVGLRPPPANLAGPAIVPAHSDAYLFYRLTVGKRGSAMPAFGASLSEAERWEIIAYLRSLSLPAAPSGHALERAQPNG